MRGPMMPSHSQGHRPVSWRWFNARGLDHAAVIQATPAHHLEAFGYSS